MVNKTIIVGLAASTLYLNGCNDGEGLDQASNTSDTSGEQPSLVVDNSDIINDKVQGLLNPDSSQALDNGLTVTPGEKLSDIFLNTNNIIQKEYSIDNKDNSDQLFREDYTWNKNMVDGTLPWAIIGKNAITPMTAEGTLRIQTNWNSDNNENLVSNEILSTYEQHSNKNIAPYIKSSYAQKVEDISTLNITLPESINTDGVNSQVIKILASEPASPYNATSESQVSTEASVLQAQQLQEAILNDLQYLHEEDGLLTLNTENITFEIETKAILFSPEEIGIINIISKELYGEQHANDEENEQKLLQEYYSNPQSIEEKLNVIQSKYSERGEVFPYNFNILSNIIDSKFSMIAEMPMKLEWKNQEVSGDIPKNLLLWSILTILILRKPIAKGISKLAKRSKKPKNTTKTKKTKTRVSPTGNTYAEEITDTDD